MTYSSNSTSTTQTTTSPKKTSQNTTTQQPDFPSLIEHLGFLIKLPRKHEFVQSTLRGQHIPTELQIPKTQEGTDSTEDNNISSSDEYLK